MFASSSTHDRPPVTFRQSPGLDARLGWLVPVTLFSYACYYSVMDYPEPTLVWLSSAVAVSLMLCIAVSSYSLVSLVTVVCVYLLFHFSIGPVFNLMLARPRIRPDLWITTDLAQIACIVAALAMAAGVWFTRIFFSRQRSPVYGDTIHLVAPVGAGMLVMLYVPVFAFFVVTGVYDWRFISVPKLTASISMYGGFLNQVSNMENLASAGICLQLFRYVHTGRRIDLYFLIIFASVPVLLFAPTGNRSQALLHIPYLALFYAALEPNRKRALVVIFWSAALVVFLTAAIGAYRSQPDERAASFEGQWEQIMSYQPLEGQIRLAGRQLTPLEHLAERLNDYVTCGRIIAWTPQIVPFRRTERLSDILSMWVPKILFPERRNIGQSAIVSTRYEVTGWGGASSPSTLPGDLFSRWGWPGIVLGLFLLGCSLALTDRWLLRIWSTRLIIFYGLFIPRAFSLGATDVIGAIAVLGREMLVAAFVAAILSVLIDSFFSKTYRYIPGHGLQPAG